MDMPEAVRKTFARLKLEYPFYILLSIINNRFYVYHSSSIWDKEKRKVRSNKEYLGRITEDGKFIKKSVKEGIAPQINTLTSINSLDKVDEKILTHLSMNCRLPISTIAERVGLSVQATERRKENLERRYGIRYFTSINYFKLGYSTYLAFVSFKDKKPDMAVLKSVLEKSPRIQLAMAAQGAYDLVLYILAENSAILNEVIFDIRKDERIGDYESIWNVVVFDQAYGCVPLRDLFFDLLEKKVWHRTKTIPKPASDSLTYREYVLLRELNSEGNKPFAEIEKMHDMGHGAAKYTFDKIKAKELIWRPTMTMGNYGVKYNAMIFISILNKAAFIRDREKFLRYIIKDYDAPSNRFSLEGDTLSPDGEVFLMPVLRDGELEMESGWLSEQINGIKLESLIITKILLGELCYRKLDNAHAQQTNILVSEYKMEPPKETIDYILE